MDRTSLFSTSTATLNDLLSNGRTYRVPPYQRDYSWAEENWEDLWQDIVEIASADQQHYMGSIVLQQKGDVLTVIDGQQRLATLSILALAVLAQLKRLEDVGIEPKENKERFDLLRSQYIGSKDPASLKSTSRLTLNANDDDFYQAFLIQFRAPPTAPSVRKLPESQARLWNAYRYFFSKVAERFSGREDGAALAQFLNQTVGQRLNFIRIVVQDELSAFTVFETLNARGLELTSTDLLKNYLFSLADDNETDLRHVQYEWQQLTNVVPFRDFPDFLRHYINSKQRFIRRDRLFKELRKTTTDKKGVYELLEKLQSAAQWFVALDDADDDFWGSFPESRRYVRALNLFGAKQYKPVILACARVGVSPPDLERILRACAVIAFRYQMIAQRNPSRLEEVYNSVAIAVHEAGVADVRSVIAGLKEVYLSDDDFESAFREIRIPMANRKQKLVRYILCELETNRHGTDIDFESSRATVEHILPENPSAEWDADFPPDVRDAWIPRLGNYALLERNLNKEAANRSFGEKRELFARSQYAMTREITDEEWTRDEIRARQKEMARMAKSVWRID